MGNLAAGANAALTAENPGLRTLVVGLGWESIPSRGPQAELVPIAIMCDSHGKALSNDHLVFFNQLASPDGAVSIVGDDQEQIEVDLPSVPPDVAKIAFIVFVDPELRGPGTFASVRSAYIRVATGEERELLRFDVPTTGNHAINAMIFGELYRHGSEWKFRALGQGYTSGVGGVATDFRVDL